MADLFISRQADAELRQIWRCIALESPAAADRLLLRIDERLQVLRGLPSLVRHAVRRYPEGLSYVG